MKHRNALMAEKLIPQQENGDYLFASPKSVLCVGHLHPAETTPTITIRLPRSLTPAAFVAYLREALPAPIVVDVSNMSEGQFLNFQLDVIRSTGEERLTDDQVCELEYERMKLFADELRTGFSPDGLDAAAQMNVYDLFDR